MNLLKNYLEKDTTKWPKDEGVHLSQSCQAARLHALRRNFEKGYPLAHLDDYRSEIESHYKESMTHSSHMSALIPILQDIVESELKTMLSGKPVSIIFDGGVCQFLRCYIIQLFILNYLFYNDTSILLIDKEVTMESFFVCLLDT